MSQTITALRARLQAHRLTVTFAEDGSVKSRRIDYNAHVTCDKCGKNFPIIPGDEGQTIVCMACGTRTAVPRLSENEHLLLSQGGRDAGQEHHADHGANDDADAPARRIWSLNYHQPRRIEWFVGWYRIAAVAAACLLMLIGIWFSTRPTWEQANRAALLTLKSQAEAAARDERYFEALALYREVELRVGTRAIRDPLLCEALREARIDRERVFLQLVAERATPREENEDNADPKPANLLPAGVLSA